MFSTAEQNKRSVICFGINVHLYSTVRPHVDSWKESQIYPTELWKKVNLKIGSSVQGKKLKTNEPNQNKGDEKNQDWGRLS